jgi:GntR family transcriptional regulator
MDGAQAPGPALEPDPNLFAPGTWFREGAGPRYLQLARHVARSIEEGRLGEGAQLPPERDLALMADVSRVTVRKAVARVQAEGLVEARRGAGSFVRAPAPKLEQSLSRLTSFTEYMRARGRESSSTVLVAGLFMPAPEESLALGIAAEGRVARIERLRAADGQVIAWERSSLPPDVLPDPRAVTTSLYTVLREGGLAPVRAIQRITAVNLSAHEARMLHLAEAAAALRIDRTGYLATGRPIEFTRGLYRSDVYDFVAELKLGA